MRTEAQPRGRAEALASLGLRLPCVKLPGDVLADSQWGRWHTVERAKGFHVSRESGERAQALTNTVGRTKVFRKRELAEQAAAAANFEVDAARLAAEPLLGGKAGAA